MDVVERLPIQTSGAFKANSSVSTYYLVGPNYFYFFAAAMVLMGLVFIFVAMGDKERTHVRT